MIVPRPAPGAAMRARIAAAPEHAVVLELVEADGVPLVDVHPLLAELVRAAGVLARAGRAAGVRARVVLELELEGDDEQEVCS